MIKIKVDDDEVKKLFGGLDNSRKIISRALNRTVKGVRTDATKQISQSTGAQLRFVRRRLILRNSKPSNLNAVISGSSKRLPVTAFGARQTKKGVTFKGKNGRRQLIKGAFIERAPTKKNFRGVFKRKYDKAKNATGKDYKGRQRKGRLPVRVLKAVSIGHKLVTSPVVNKVHESIDNRWNKSIKQSIEFELNGKKNIKP